VHLTKAEAFAVVARSVAWALMGRIGGRA